MSCPSFHLSPSRPRWFWWMEFNADRRKYAHTNSYNSAMTVIAQDDHVTAGAWAAYDSP